jgi:hypothetical protein
LVCFAAIIRAARPSRLRPLVAKNARVSWLGVIIASGPWVPTTVPMLVVAISESEGYHSSILMRMSS